jgi:hypothetical protein
MEIEALLNEINCRIEHGADSNGHLEYVQRKLDEILHKGEKTITDKDGWIPHTTGKQPVADDVVVEVKYKDDSCDIGLAKREPWNCPYKITHYRIVEDKQKLEEKVSRGELINQLDERYLDSRINQWTPYDVLSHISEYLQNKGI